MRVWIEVDVPDTWSEQAINYARGLIDPGALDNLRGIWTVNAVLDSFAAVLGHLGGIHGEGGVERFDSGRVDECSVCKRARVVLATGHGVRMPYDQDVEVPE